MALLHSEQTRDALSIRFDESEGAQSVTAPLLLFRVFATVLASIILSGLPCESGHAQMRVFEKTRMSLPVNFLLRAAPSKNHTWWSLGN